MKILTLIKEREKREDAGVILRRGDIERNEKRRQIKSNIETQ